MGLTSRDLDNQLTVSYTLFLELSITIPGTIKDIFDNGLYCQFDTYKIKDILNYSEE